MAIMRKGGMRLNQKCNRIFSGTCARSCLHAKKKKPFIVDENIKSTTTVWWCPMMLLDCLYSRTTPDSAFLMEILEVYFWRWLNKLHSPPSKQTVSDASSSSSMITSPSEPQKPIHTMTCSCAPHANVNRKTHGTFWNVHTKNVLHYLLNSRLTLPRLCNNYNYTHASSWLSG